MPDSLVSDIKQNGKTIKSQVIKEKVNINFNNNADGRRAKISCGNISREFAFGKYEAKTVIFDGKDFKGKELWV